MTCLRETFCGKIVIVKVCEGPKGPFFMLVGLFHESKAERLNTQGAFGLPFYRKNTKKTLDFNQEMNWIFLSYL